MASKVTGKVRRGFDKHQNRNKMKSAVGSAFSTMKLNTLANSSWASVPKCQVTSKVKDDEQPRPNSLKQSQEIQQLLEEHEAILLEEKAVQNAERLEVYKKKSSRHKQLV